MTRQNGVLLGCCLVVMGLWGSGCGGKASGRDAWGNAGDVTFVIPDESGADWAQVPADGIRGNDNFVPDTVAPDGPEHDLGAQDGAAHDTIEAHDETEASTDCGSCTLPDLRVDLVPDLVPDSGPDSGPDLTEPDTNVPDVAEPLDTNQPDDVEEVPDVGPACTLNDPLHCGPGCLVCDGVTPHCLGGTCTICNLDLQCGPLCSPCPVATPVCRPDGVGCVGCLGDLDCDAGLHCNSLAQCVACLEDSHCAQSEFCNTTLFQCLPDTPSLGCDDNLTPNAYTCAKAKVIGRKSVSGVQKTFTGYLSTTYANSDDVSQCDDISNEEFYRIYLGAGHTMALELYTASSTYDPLIKIYSGTDCDDNGYGDLIICSDVHSGTTMESYSFTAVSEGWYSIVADGNFNSTMFESGTSYTLRVKVTCAPANCGCL